MLKYIAFLKVVELGSFSQVAKLLNYSQSGISRMIADLETEWNVKLLKRSRSGIRLTSAGVQLLPKIERLCQDYISLKAEIDDLHELSSGIIRIGTFSSFATHRLPSIIERFQKDFPGIDYELFLGDYSEIESGVSVGRVDLGITRLPSPTSFDAFAAEEDPLVAVLPKNHPLAKLDSIPLESLCQDPFLMLERNGQSDIADLFEKHNLSPHVHFTTWDDYAIMAMVESGLGVGILPKLILNRIPYNIAIRKLNVPAKRTIGIIIKDRQNIPPIVRCFLNYCPIKNEDPNY